MSLRDLTAFIGTGPALDPYAQGLMTAGGITDPIIRTAVNNYCIAMKKGGVLAKKKAVWLCVGGTSDTCKLNLLDPQDTDGAFRLTFTGTWNFSANGIKPTAVNSYARTYLNPNTVGLGQNSVHLATYIKTFGVVGQKYVMGAVVNSPTFPGLAMAVAEGVSCSLMVQGDQTNGGLPTQTVPGMYSVTRTVSGNFRFFDAAGTKTTVTNASTLVTNLELFLGAINFSGSVIFTAVDYVFPYFSVGNVGLTDAEDAVERAACIQLQTDLSRA